MMNSAVSGVAISQASRAGKPASTTAEWQIGSSEASEHEQYTSERPVERTVERRNSRQAGLRFFSG